MIKLTKLHSRLILIIITAIVLIGALSLYLYNNRTKISVTIPSTQPKTSTMKTNNNKPQIGSTSKDSSNSSPETVPNNTSTSSTQATLIAPFGSFISDHSPDISGSPHPSSEESVCNTTPGAQCYIKFTNGNLTRSLSAQTVSSNGTAYWSWDIDTADINQGSWTVTAIASLNGQIKSTQDSQVLQVGP